MVTEITSSFPHNPTSSSSNAYTFDRDGLVFLYALRGSTMGYTLFVEINGKKVFTFPAETAYASASVVFPVQKGQRMKIYTDNSSNTWSISRVDFIG